MTDLAWREGMADWQPIHAQPDLVEASLPPEPLNLQQPATRLTETSASNLPRSESAVLTPVSEYSGTGKKQIILGTIWLILTGSLFIFMLFIAWESRGIKQPAWDCIKFGALIMAVWYFGIREGISCIKKGLKMVRDQKQQSDNPMK